MATLNANVVDANAGEIGISAEPTITLYVFGATGTHDTHYVAMEVSPDGSNWMRLPYPVRGLGEMTYTIAAQKARAAVDIPEGSTSTINVFLMAK